MTKYALIVLAGASLSIIGIASSMPFVVTAGTLAACATILLALLSYFEAVH